MTKNQMNADLFGYEENFFKKYLPNVKRIEDQGHIVNEWDIPHTIQALSYLVHSDYRYYGKFPSVVAGQILEQLPPPTSDHYVLDNFCGSGTTLVEAKLRNIPSYGIDISWLSVLASNVKTRHINLDGVRQELYKIAKWFDENLENFNAPNDKFTEKWFSQKVSRDLIAIQFYIKNIEKSDVRDFLLLAFIGIVRRVSKAYDGEVRPHINKEKKVEMSFLLFQKKLMIC